MVNNIMTLSSLNHFLNTPLGIGVLLLVAVAFFIAIWFGVSRFFLALTFLRRPKIRRFAQAFSSFMLAFISIAGRDSENIFSRAYNWFIPDFLGGPLLIFFAICLIVTFLPEKFMHKSERPIVGPQ